MNLKSLSQVLFATGFIFSAPFAYAGSDHGHKDEHADEHKEEKHDDGHGDEHEEGHIEISHAMIKQAGIIYQQARDGEIKQTLNVYGKTTVDPSAISQVKARFPGIITQLTANIGDTVQAGDVIAQVESSDSLKLYKVKAPISGVITKRNANPGELADKQSLFTIKNFNKLWVEYQVFPSQMQFIKQGQAVDVFNEHQQTSTTIKHLFNDATSPFTLARVPLDNTQGHWSPGLLLSGSVVINHISVPVVIDNRALQVFENEQVIFIKNEHGFEARKVTLGQTDNHNSQVLSGLSAGEQYAIENSYLLKADLEKSSASHHH